MTEDESDASARANDLEARFRILCGAMRAFAEATTDTERLFDVVARTMTGIVADGCIVRTLAEGWLTPVALHLPLESRLTDADTAARVRNVLEAPQRVSDYAWGERMIATGEPFLAERLDTSMLTPDLAAIYETLGVHSLLVTVLRVRGESIGTLSLFRFHPRAPSFGQRELDLALALSDHAALAISNARLLRSALRELSHRERAEAALRKTESELRQAQKMEAVGRLAGGIAHDFNNLLSVILSYADIMLSGVESDDPLTADLLEIQTAGERAAELTRQLLAFSRQQVLQPRVVDLNQVILGMERMIHRLLGADVELTLTLGPNLGRVTADPGQIEQVIMNLAVNARDAIGMGGRLAIQTKDVTLDRYYASEHLEVTPGPYVMLSASDTGRGMDPETVSHVFEPFFTTKERGKGTGLGLSTVFGIVKQSGGHVSVHSEPGQGSTFRLYFPRTSAKAESPSSPPPPPESVRGNETVLLVEDDDQVRSVARAILTRMGYTVLEAPGAGEALLVSEQHAATIHLLVAGVVLPRMSGPQLSARLREARPDMKVLFMSGYADEAIRRQGILDMDAAFLQKPLTPETLGRKVRDVLSSQRRGNAA